MMTPFVSVLHVLVLFGFLLSCTATQDTQNTPFTLASIASAAPQSDSFVLVADEKCDASVVTVVYELYARNAMVFQTCVSDGRYTIFPFSGTHPTKQQIGDMSRSLACRAIFTSILFAGIPECEVSNFPMRAAAETLLKIAVDIDKHLDAENAVPSTERFVQMMEWRRDVNLAADAGVPCDSSSQLYAEYSDNLYTITTSGLVQLTMNKEVQYRSTPDGSFSQDKIKTTPKLPGLRSGSGSDGEIMTVYATDATVEPSKASGTSTKSNAKQSTNTQEIEKTVTSDANSSSAADQIKWSKTLMAAVVLAALFAFV